jgi:hypothetical protein
MEHIGCQGFNCMEALKVDSSREFF